MVKLLLNGESHECASSYREIKTRHYPALVKWRGDGDIADLDFFELFNILTDGKYTGFQKTIENQITVDNCVNWILTEDFKFSEVRPKTLAYKDKLIDIPEHPRELSIGQNIHLRRDYIDQSKILEDNLAIATAIYLQPVIDNSLFNLKRAIQIAKDIDEMPAYLIYPIGFFLLNRALKFGTRPEQTLPQIKTSLIESLKATWHGLRKYIS